MKSRETGPPTKKMRVAAEQSKQPAQATALSRPRPSVFAHPPAFVFSMLRPLLGPRSLVPSVGVSREWLERNKSNCARETKGGSLCYAPTALVPMDFSDSHYNTRTGEILPSPVPDAPGTCGAFCDKHCASALQGYFDACGRARTLSVELNMRLPYNSVSFDLLVSDVDMRAEGPDWKVDVPELAAAEFPPRRWQEDRSRHPVEVRNRTTGMHEVPAECAREQELGGLVCCLLSRDPGFRNANLNISVRANWRSEADREAAWLTLCGVPTDPDVRRIVDIGRHVATVSASLRDGQGSQLPQLVPLLFNVYRVDVPEEAEELRGLPVATEAERTDRLAGDFVHSLFGRPQPGAMFFDQVVTIARNPRDPWHELSVSDLQRDWMSASPAVRRRQIVGRHTPAYWTRLLLAGLPAWVRPDPDAKPDAPAPDPFAGLDVAQRCQLAAYAFHAAYSIDGTAIVGLPASDLVERLGDIMRRVTPSDTDLPPLRYGLSSSPNRGQNRALQWCKAVVAVRDQVAADHARDCEALTDGYSGCYKSIPPMAAADFSDNHYDGLNLVIRRGYAWRLQTFPTCQTVCDKYCSRFASEYVGAWQRASTIEIALTMLPPYASTKFQLLVQQPTTLVVSQASAWGPTQWRVQWSVATEMAPRAPVERVDGNIPDAVARCLGTSSTPLVERLCCLMGQEINVLGEDSSLRLQAQVSAAWKSESTSSTVWQRISGKNAPPSGVDPILLGKHVQAFRIIVLDANDEPLPLAELSPLLQPPGLPDFPRWWWYRPQNAELSRALRAGLFLQNLFEHRADGTAFQQTLEVLGRGPANQHWMPSVFPKLEAELPMH